MRYRDQFDDDEDDEPKNSELTLGVGSLLAIFFGMVLLCGIFFGFGYTLGHGKTVHRQINPSAATPENTSADASQSTTTGAKPTAQQAAPPPTQAAAGTTAASGTVPGNTSSTTTMAGSASGAQPATQPAQQQAATYTQPAPRQTATPAAQQAFQPAVPSAQPVSTPVRQEYMVQVAAVSRPRDASVLISALQQRGFHAIARSSAQDNLMHIQVGPFASLAAANQMRARLMADGYNAILKP